MIPPWPCTVFFSLLVPGTVTSTFGLDVFLCPLFVNISEPALDKNVLSPDTDTARQEKSIFKFFCCF
jgi:hypothetical protein